VCARVQRKEESEEKAWRIESEVVNMCKRARERALT